MGQVQISAVLDSITKTGLLCGGLGFGGIIDKLNGKQAATAQLVNCDAAAKGEQAANNDVKPCDIDTVGVPIAPRNVAYAKLMQNLYNNYAAKPVFYGGAKC